MSSNDTSHAVSGKMDVARVTALIGDLLQRLAVPYDGIVAGVSAGSTVFTINTTDSRILIGHNGETLSALNHIVKKILEPELADGEHMSVDVNGYLARKVKSLEDQARLVADRARTFRYDIEMTPMSAYERMIVHVTLKDMPDIETRSYGEGALRHIVVRYVDPSAPTAETARD